MTVAKVAEVSKKAAEVAKNIEKTCNVSKEMKSVADYEGKKDFSIFVEKMPSSSEKLSNVGSFNDSFPLKESGSPSERIEINKIAFQNDDFPRQERITNTGASIEKSSEAEARKTIDNGLQEQEILEPRSSQDISKDLEQKGEGLTDEQKKAIKEETGWSDDIVDSIRTTDEAKIYMDAELQEGEVNGKKALLQLDIEGKDCNELKWPDWSNKDLAEEGYPPRDKTGRPYELHHVGQNPNSPLAELTYEQHHCDGNFKKLHTFEDSSIDRQQFNKERKEYWMARSQTL